MQLQIILIKKSQMQKNKHCVFSLTCEFFIDTENPFWHESQWGNEQEGEDEATKERM